MPIKVVFEEESGLVNLVQIQPGHFKWSPF